MKLNEGTQREIEIPSNASSLHCSRAFDAATMTAFSKLGSFKGVLVSSMTVLSSRRLAFLDASLQTFIWSKQWYL